MDNNSTHNRTVFDTVEDLAAMLQIPLKGQNVTGFTLNVNHSELPTLEVRREIFEDEDITKVSHSFELHKVGTVVPSETYQLVRSALEAMVGESTRQGLLDMQGYLSPAESTNPDVKAALVAILALLKTMPEDVSESVADHIITLGDLG